jgi:hypothetical protein
VPKPSVKRPEMQLYVERVFMFLSFSNAPAKIHFFLVNENFSQEKFAKETSFMKRSPRKKEIQGFKNYTFRGKVLWIVHGTPSGVSCE